MEKTLKKYTTIPQDLYVQRKADAQLRRIIDEMERPGYVLVARQMGKTNLLLNAMRTLKGPDRLFAYVDLSNNFSSERDCYRNIIDRIVEPNADLFLNIINELNAQREKKSLSPHKEYERELRLILNELKGRLIIILDEIDALRSVDYSDNIFAQIRSNYFERTNFPQFNNLTYIMSGVIEPTDLIKDKNKSPFNIGEKIYLDDFTLEEHNQFIEKSKMILPVKVSQQIFSWTNGNPRLTFDICSEIEDLQLAGEEITPKTVNELVEKKYFIHFDVAPIDHIRDIVSKQKLVRKAIINIQKGKSIDSLELRRKLYLYGIVNSQIDNDKLKIKNKIIETSLSLDWLQSLERMGADLLSLGLEKIRSLEYSDAINILEEYLNNTDIPLKSEQHAIYNIGLAHYNQRNFKSALAAFTHDAFQKEKGEAITVYSAKAYAGVCNLNLKNNEEAERLLLEVCNNKQECFAYPTALFNLGSYYFKLNRYEEAVPLYEKLLLVDIDLKENDASKLKVIAHAKLALLHFLLERPEDALREIELACNLAEDSDILELLFYKHYITGQKNPDLIREIARRIIEQKLVFSSEHYDISFKEENNLNYLLGLYETDEGIFDQLLDYTSTRLLNSTKSRVEILYEMATSSEKREISLSIFDQLVKRENLDGFEYGLDVIRHRALTEHPKGPYFIEIFERYRDKFKNKIDHVIQVDDISIFAFGIRHYSNVRDIDTALQLCDEIISRTKGASPEIRYESLIIYYWYANLYYTNKEFAQAKYYADITVQIIETSQGVKNSLLDEKGIKFIEGQLAQIRIGSNELKPFVRSQKKYNRNDRVKVRYLDTTVREGKYKSFEADLIAERCQILE
jgi:tetratricopeptide (TPR) repeat protein